jgi:2-methylcitrate dehydratase PrpD
MENIASQQIQQAMKKVVCVTDERLEPDFPRKWMASAKISTTDGRNFETVIDYPKGDPENPLSWAELEDKFEAIASPVFNEAKRKEIVDRVKSLESEADVLAFQSILST